MTNMPRTAPLRAVFCVLALFMFLLPTALQAAGERAGRVERQKGEASRVADGQKAALALHGGIFVGDEIETGEGARLVIRFLDQSTLTLGAKAKVKIDAMIYDTTGLGDAPDAQALNFLQGVFKFVSGKVAKADRQAFALNTPVATIGIRGTEFVGGELTVGMPPGTSHIGFQVREGAIEVTNSLGAVTLDQPGEGTFIPLDGSAAPTPVRQWTAEEAAEADALLAF